jgi:hypothetical protein
MRAVIEGRMGQGGIGGSVPALFSQFMYSVKSLAILTGIFREIPKNFQF